ncbi:hypothetical protein C8J57DRAFT_1516628 [Mycena rebaudengoi]|nr:hypothetical protein C8J57DRAFT_1516628 [Mycena rebaudengoi]
MRAQRAKTTLAATRAGLKSKSTYLATRKRAYNTQIRSFALAFTRAGCAQARLGPLLIRIGKLFGVQLNRSMSRRTVGRIITEAGIKVRLQLGYELVRAKAVCLSSDRTSRRNIKYEARHVSYSVPTYSTDANAAQEAFTTRLYEGWDITNQKIIDAYINSPLGHRNSLEGYSYELDDLWRKMVAYNSDHAADVRSCAVKCGERKKAVITGDMARKATEEMTNSEVRATFWEVVRETCDDPEGHPSSLPDELRIEAYQALAADLGDTVIDTLPEEQQQILLRMLVCGCCAHKDHNCTKAGMAGMAAAYDDPTLGLTPPILLANEDNSATIALGEAGDSAAVERALRASQRGGYKLVGICGNLFRHQDDKKGHQDLHRHFFSKVKFDLTGKRSTTKFPDCSNNRYRTHLAGATKLLKYHAAYIEFLNVIRDMKQTPGLNHQEQNTFDSLQDKPTMREIIVMTAYKNAIPDVIVEHIQKLIDNTDLLLDPSQSPEDATLDGQPFPDQWRWTPFIFESTLPAWKRFSKEFEAGGAIDTLTPAKKLLIFVPATNDRNEGILGGWGGYSRAKSSGTVQHYSAQAAYHQNNTEAFADTRLTTEEDALYVMRLARIEDASERMKKFRDDLLAFKNKIAEEAREKQREKEAEAAAELLRLQAVVVITDPDLLQALPVKKKNVPMLREQLDVRRDLWKDEVLIKTKLKDISKKADMLAAILAADQCRNAMTEPETVTQSRMCPDPIPGLPVSALVAVPCPGVRHPRPARSFRGVCPQEARRTINTSDVKPALVRAIGIDVLER